MTEEEEKQIQERLKKAQELSKEIKSIERVFAPESELDINLYVGSKRGSAMSSVSLSKELADDIRSAVLLTLRSKLIDLKEKYDKL